MSNYVPTKHHLREVLLFLFNSKKSATESHRLLSGTYLDYTPSIKTCAHWFRRFKSGDFDTEAKDGPGHLFLYSAIFKNTVRSFLFVIQCDQARLSVFFRCLKCRIGMDEGSFLISFSRAFI